MQASQYSKKNIPGSQNSHFKEQISDPLKKSPFSLSLVSTLVESDLFAISYSQKSQLILASSLDGLLFLYDTKTLLAQRIKTYQLDGSVLHISYSQESDTFIIRCKSGSIYTYKTCYDQLEMVQKSEEEANYSKAPIQFLDSSHYVFGFNYLKWLSIGKLNDKMTTKFDLKDSHCTAIHHFSEKNLLFSGLSSGCVRIFITKQLPHLKAFYLFRAHEAGKQVNAIQSLQVNGKEYVITSGQDGTVKIWHSLKRRMRLLKVIVEKAWSLVYLEKYKMLVTDSKESNGIKFWKLPCGKLERELDFSRGSWRGCWRGNLLLMEDKNVIACVAIGVLMQSTDAIEFIQIHPE